MELINNRKEFSRYLERSIKEHRFDIEIVGKILDFDIGTEGFDEIAKPITMENCSFKSFSFEGTHFKSDVRIRACKFNTLEISACGFYADFLMENSLIIGRLNLLDVTFYGTTYLYGNDFLNGSNIFSKRDSFGAVEFKKGLYLF